MRRVSTALSLALGITLAGAGRADSLDQEIANLANKLSKSLAALEFKHVAAIDFTDLQGQPTELGRFLSERLAVEIVSSGGVSMVDRANIRSILAEHKLTEQGLVNPANAKKLGEFAGVDAILIGSVTALDDGIVLMVKAIATSSANIVAAGKISFPKTSEIQQLLNRSISSSSTAGVSSGSGVTGDGGTSYQDATAIATKDIGPLRVVLKAAMLLTSRNRRGQSVNGLRCTFEFVSRETQRDVLVAMNAAPEQELAGAYYRPRMGSVLRTTAVDSRGVPWALATSDVTGVSVVSAGLKDGLALASASDIVSLLRRFDESGSEIGTRSVGVNPHRDAGGLKSRQFQYQFVFGSVTTIPPGGRVTVVMNFVQEAGETTSGAPPQFFQIASELVVAVVTTSGSRSYSLENLLFDRVSLPTRK